MDDSKARLRNEILWELEYNEYCKDVLPHYGMVPDFTPRYARLAQLIKEYLDNECKELGAQQRKAAEGQRHLQRESKSGQTNIEGC